MRAGLRFERHTTHCRLHRVEVRGGKQDAARHLACALVELGSEPFLPTCMLLLHDGHCRLHGAMACRRFTTLYEGRLRRWRVRPGAEVAQHLCGIELCRRSWRSRCWKARDAGRAIWRRCLVHALSIRPGRAVGARKALHPLSATRSERVCLATALCAWWTCSLARLVTVTGLLDLVRQS